MSNIHEVPSDITFDKFPVIDRRSYSEHLTNFLNSKAEGGYVLNLNAEWGAGKTTFLQCWYNELREKHPVVYFDAWKSDFTHDAMLAITECFHSQLMSPLVEDKALLSKLKDQGAHLLKVALPSLLVGYLKHKTGTDSDDSLFSDISKELNIEIGDDDLGDAVKETMRAMLNQKKKVEGIHTFRRALENLSVSYLEAYPDKSAPIYVLVDELDRCRPTYAIEVIECIKHFFNTRNFVFVLATDTDQLQHSIKAVYGEGFNSANYLSRFFNRTAVLPSPTIREYIYSYLKQIVGHFPRNEVNFNHLIESIFIWHGMNSLREINKVLNDVEVFKSSNRTYKVLCVIILSILKHKYPSHYKLYYEKGWNPYPTQHGATNLNPDENLIQVQTTPFFPLSQRSNQSISIILHYVLDGIDDLDSDTYDIIRFRELSSRDSIKEACYALAHVYLLQGHGGIQPSSSYLSVLNFAGHLSE